MQSGPAPYVGVTLSMTELPSPPCVDAAIEAAYRAACDRGYRLALAICGDAAKSEDVVHDVFARLLGRKDALRLETLDAYVARSVRNAAYDQVRGRAPCPWPTASSRRPRRTRGRRPTPSSCAGR